MSERALLLDIGGVICLPDRVRIQECLGAVGIAATLDQITRGHYLGMAAEDRVAGPFAKTLPHYLDGLLVAVGCPPEANERARARLLQNFKTPGAWMEPLRESVEALVLLATAGIRLGFVSNADGEAEADLQRLGICQVGPGPGTRVEVVVDSGQVGVRKPDPRIFQIALNAMGLEAGEVAFVGDSVRKDVEGAARAGLRPIHFDPFRLCSGPTHQHVQSLIELLPS